MKKNLIVLLFCFATILCAQNIDWSWVEAAGGEMNDAGSSVAVTDEFIYLTGSFKLSSMFGNTELVSNGNFDVFVAKMDLAGNWIWAVSAGGMGFDRSYDIVLDNEDNVYVIGRFSNEVDFGSDHLVSEGYTDIFIAKLDSDGNWLWAKQAGGNSHDFVNSIALDSDENIYITGSFWETATFGDSTFTSSGADDIFISKLDANGEWLWAQHCSGDFGDAGTALCIDQDNNIYFTGEFNGPTNFGSFVLYGDGWNDMFVAKLDQDGDWLMLLEVISSTTSTVIPKSICLDSNNSVSITGEFNESLYFGLPALTLTTNGIQDIFVAKLNSEFMWDWTTSAGGSGDDCGNSIEWDSDGNIWLTGHFSEIAEFGNEQLESLGETDIFVSVLDFEGEWVHSEQAGGIGEDIGNAIDLNTRNEVVIIGYFSETASFGGSSVTSNGDDDIFVTMINQQTSAHELLICSDIDLSSFPNPFNPATTISYQLSADSPVELSIYNIKGQKVKTLVNEVLPAGKYSTIWNGRDSNGNRVSSGIYFYKLLIDRKTKVVKKMMLIK
ncbi:MAG: SBBP repeat-containing protein [Candidatus Cloacimonetes bacterium]|nr:SBBP repeat-containing protein [Candidatus Cloacimonadota bacterium]